MPRIKFSPENILRIVVQTVLSTKSFVVNVNWNGNNWNLNTWNRNDNTWNEDKRVFSPENNRFLSLINWWEFLFEVLYAIHLSVFLLLPNLLIELRISYHQIHVFPMQSVKRISKYLWPIALSLVWVTSVLCFGNLQFVTIQVSVKNDCLPCLLVCSAIVLVWYLDIHTKSCKEPTYAR